VVVVDTEVAAVAVRSNITLLTAEYSTHPRSTFSFQQATEVVVVADTVVVAVVDTVVSCTVVEAWGRDFNLASRKSEHWG